jgi:hypothetical protein
MLISLGAVVSYLPNHKHEPTMDNSCLRRFYKAERPLIAFGQPLHTSRRLVCEY